MDTSEQVGIETSSSTKGRRRTVEEKRRIVEGTLEAGASVARVARRHAVNANQVFYWRKKYREGRLGKGRSSNLLPVTVSEIPSSNIDNCAGVSDTVPLVACGQMKRPRSSRFAKRHSPSPSHHNILIRSPRRPRNTNTCPENGFSWRAVCTIPLSPVKPRRRSVTPAAIQMRVPAGSPIIRANIPTPCAVLLFRHCP